jgi:glycerate kinase
MNIKEVITEKSFEESVTAEQAASYIEETLSSASKMSIHVTWGFDEAQADGFHNNWDGEKFLRCVERILREEYDG